MSGEAGPEYSAQQGENERRSLSSRDPLAEEDECPSCAAKFGASLRAASEEALGRGYHVLRFSCGTCFSKLAASTDDVGRLGITLDKSGVSGEFLVIGPEEAKT